jgi:hypothetical protein
MDSIRDEEIVLSWHPRPPRDAVRYRRAIRGGLGGPIYVAFEGHGPVWRVAQAHVSGHDDRREDVRRVLQAVGLPVE